MTHAYNRKTALKSTKGLTFSQNLVNFSLQLATIGPAFYPHPVNFAFCFLAMCGMRCEQRRGLQVADKGMRNLPSTTTIVFNK